MVGNVMCGRAVYRVVGRCTGWYGDVLLARAVYCAVGRCTVR